MTQYYLNIHYSNRKSAFGSFVPNLRASTCIGVVLYLVFVFRTRFGSADMCLVTELNKTGSQGFQGDLNDASDEPQKGKIMKREYGGGSRQSNDWKCSGITVLFGYLFVSML